MRALQAGAIAALLLISCRAETPAKPADTEKPILFLLTSLPLMFGEQFGLERNGSPALEALQERYRVRAVDLPSRLPERGLLLSAQPRALPAEELVELDKWVRNGGRLLLLADPMLEWPSELPLGDLRRPPIAFADTGLLEHWGLQLDQPEQRGAVQMRLRGEEILAASPGQLIAAGKQCKVRDGGLVARCKIGEGAAVVVADADLLNVGSDPRDDKNLPALLSQLESLSH